MLYVVRGAAVAQSPGHQPGNREIPGLVPRFDSLLGLFYSCCFLGQETLPQRRSQGWVFALPSNLPVAYSSAILFS